MWTDWKDLDEGFNEINSGVYKMRIVNSAGQSYKIKRFLGYDSNGIIAIGSTNNLKTRINGFNKVIMDKKYKHSESKKLLYNIKYSRFNSVFKKYKIQFSIKKVSNKEKYKEDESELIKCYFKEFGEVPPLNSNLPNKKHWLKLICD